MDIDAKIAGFERCQTLDELKLALQPLIEDYGFAAFNFLDTGNPHLDRPFYMGTSGKAWEEEYAGNGFVHVDAAVAHARRTNSPFHWGEVAMPAYESGRKPGAIKTMEAARDHGLEQGFVVPYHFRDQIGGVCSALVVLFWKDQLRRFRFLISGRRHELHLVVIYWMQCAIDIIARDIRQRSQIFRNDPGTDIVVLTDRERDVLGWAARGKTAGETGEILGISHETAETHIRNAMRKLNAVNKTHAVARSICLGLVVP